MIESSPTAQSRMLGTGTCQFNVRLCNVRLCALNSIIFCPSSLFCIKVFILEIFQGMNVLGQ